MKMTIKKIAFQKLPQGALIPFVQNVVNRMTEQPEYAAFLPKVQALHSLNDAFVAALAQSTQGGADRIAVKKEAMAAVLQSLNELANDLNYHSNGQATWGVNAGFPVSDGRNNSATRNLLPPTSLRALPQKVSGELELRYVLPDPKLVRTTGLEFSLDKGESWQNGTYSSGQAMRIKGLPSGKSVMFRLRSIGSRQNQSGWSEPLELNLI